MNSDGFVDALYEVAYVKTIDAVIGLLESPPGRQPDSQLVALSNWYRQQNDETVKLVNELVRLSIDHAVFGLLAVIDGVRSIGEPDNEIVLQVGQAEVSADHDLHEMFRSLVDESQAAG